MIMNDDTQHNYWLSQVAPHPRRPRLEGDIKADVAIVGAGFTGLWCAYYLKRHDPALDIAIIEAERVGHGASGRNGGWVIGNLAGLSRLLEGLPLAQRRECCGLVSDNVDELGHVLDQEAIQADYHKGGAIYAAARYPDQEAIQRDYLEHLLALGHRETDCQWLDATALSERLRIENGYGGIFHRQVATVNPARLVTGLGGVVERLGVTIYEQTRATHVAEGEVSAYGGRITAARVVCATEGYAAQFHDWRKFIIPVQSAIIATEPLDESHWRQIGLAERPAFADASRIITYGQRTADGRIVFGARGTYRMGARPQNHYAIGAKAIRQRHALLCSLFPSLKDVRITHGWGGSLGLSRRFRPHAIYDRHSGLATAGGYAGEGVAASHLFGRTIADLLLERETPFTAMPWAHDDTSPAQLLKRWEPEPLRWAAAQAITLSYAGEEALMKHQRPLPLIKPALTRLNDVFASIIE